MTKEKHKTSYRGRIKNINHLLITDPTYSRDVWCRYEKNNMGGKDWRVDIQLCDVSEKYMGIHVKGIEFRIIIQSSDKNFLMVEDGIRGFDNVVMNRTKIGMDSACIAFGIDEYADEIIKSQDEWQSQCSLKTGTDGIFGEVLEGVIDGNIVFIGFDGYLDENTCYSKEDILNYICKQFKIEDLKKIKDNKKERDKQ